MAMTKKGTFGCLGMFRYVYFLPQWCLEKVDVKILREMIQCDEHISPISVTSIFSLLLFCGENLNLINAPHVNTSSWNVIGVLFSYNSLLGGSR